MTLEDKNPVSDTNCARSTVTGFGRIETLPGCNTAPVISIWNESTVIPVDGVSVTTKLSVDCALELGAGDPLSLPPPHAASAMGSV